MAFTYGSVTKCKVANGQTRNEYECRLGYEVQSQSIANNTSSVKLRLQVRSISSSYKSYGYNQTTKIDGTSLAAKEFDMRNTNTWQTFGERTITVTHNTQGKYSASKSGSFTTTASSGYSLKSGSASVTVAPATIPRYATSNQSLNKKTSSSITMNWSSDSTVDYIWYSKDNGSNWTGVDVTDGTSGTYTISGLAANTTYNIKTRVRRKDSQLTTDSSTLAVTTYQKTTASISVSSKTETSVTVSSSANVTVSSTRYRIMKSGGSYGNWQTSATFTGLSANTTYTVQVEKVGSSSGEYGYATVSVTTYDYPYCTDTPNFVLGNELTLKFYNPLGRTFNFYIIGNGTQINVTYSCSGTSYKGVNSLETSVPYLYATIPNQTSGKYQVKVVYGSSTKTRNNGNTYSTKGTEKPTFSNFAYEDTNATTKALTGNNQILVSGYSNLKVTISTTNKAVAKNSATMSKYRLNVGSMSSVEKAYSSSAAVEMSINAVNSPSITVTAIDSRSYTTAVSKTATFKAYSKPVIKSMVASRSDGGVGSQVTLSFSGTWWNDNFGSVKNTIKNIIYYYKKTTDSSWTKGNTVITASTNGNNFSGSIEIEGPTTTDKGFDVATAYNIKMSVTDALSTSTEYHLTLSSGTPAIAIFGSNVAINQMYDESDTASKLQVNGNIKLKGHLDFRGKNGAGILWKEYAHGDKFYIIPEFGDAGDNNKLQIQAAVGGGGTDPAVYNVMTISAKSGNVWAKGSIDINSDGDGESIGYKQAGTIILRNNSTQKQTILSSAGNGIYFRPKGNTNSNIQCKFINAEMTLENNSANANTCFTATRTDTGISVFMGVGSGGINHGVYSSVLGKWIVYADNSQVYLNGKASGLTISSRNTTDTWIPVCQNNTIGYTLRKFASGITHTNYGTDNDALPTMSFISYWNGAYSSAGYSNLTYCSGGRIVAKNADGTATIKNLKMEQSGVEAVTSATNGNTYFGNGSSYSGKITNLRGNTVRLYSHSGGAVYLGATGSTAVTSDENLKDIYEIDNKYIDFFNNLKPITYVYKDKGHRNHMGFGARQVEEALINAGLTTEQFAGVLKDTDVTISADEMGTKEDVHFDELYSLRYEEFIALNTYMIQKQAQQIKEQNKIIEYLKAKIEKLQI